MPNKRVSERVVVMPSSPKYVEKCTDNLKILISGSVRQLNSTVLYSSVSALMDTCSPNIYHFTFYCYSQSSYRYLCTCLAQLLYFTSLSYLVAGHS